MDTSATSTQTRLLNAANGGVNASGSTGTGSSDFMDLIVSQLAAQRALANAQAARAHDAQAIQQQRAQAKAQNERIQNDRLQNERIQRERLQNDRAQDSRDSDREEKIRAEKSAAARQQQPQPVDTARDAQSTPPQSTDRDEVAAASQTADDTAADASLPADLQKLLEEIAAQLQAAKQDSTVAAKDASAPSPQATGKEDAGNAQNAQTLALLSPDGKQKLLQALQSLMNGLPASARPTVQTLENGVLKKLDGNNLTADAAGADTTADGTSALIVSGLTPQQLTDLMKKLKDGDDKDGTLSAGNFMINLVQINPVETKKEAVFQPRSSILPAGSLAAQATADLSLGKTGTGGGDTDSGKLTSLKTPKPGANGPAQGTGASTGFDHILRILESARQSGNGQAADTDKPAQKVPDITAGNSALAATDQIVAGDVTENFSLGSVFPEGMSLAATAAAGPVTGYTLNGAAPAASLVTTAPQAVYPHPATQQIAAVLTKQVGENDSTALTLRLDPPELGRVAVKLEFSSKDKTVKAVISADKPETYMLLQRDSHVLQRSLHDAGLDTGSNGLTFELSQDGSAFGQQNRGQGGSGNTPSGSDVADVTIETRMDWSVDLSGNWHYNVLA